MDISIKHCNHGNITSRVWVAEWLRALTSDDHKPYTTDVGSHPDTQNTSASFDNQTTRDKISGNILFNL